MTEQLLKDLKSVIRGKIKTDAETLTDHSVDASVFTRMPKAVIFPKSADDITRLVK